MNICPMKVKTYCPTCLFNKNGKCVYYSEMPLPYIGKTIEEIENENN